MLTLPAPVLLGAPDGGGDPSGGREEEQKDPQAKKKAQAEEEDEEEKGGGRWGFHMGKRPQLDLGPIGFVTFRVKFQAHWRSFDPGLSTADGCGAFADSPGCLFELHRARTSLKGKLFKHLEFEVEREFKDTSRPLFIFRSFFDLQEEEVHTPWRDVFVDFKRWRRFSIQAGQFKLPFSLDQLSGDTDQDFIVRSRLGDQLAPGRDLGIMIHGRFLKKGLYYQFGLFRHDGDNSRLSGNLAQTVEDPATAQRTFAGRVTGSPFRRVLPQPFKTIELGAAFTSSPVQAGVKSLRGRTAAAEETYFPNQFVHGERRRLGAEFYWNPGRFTLKSEFARMSEERRNQALTGGDLPALLTHAWYVSGSWLVTGEHKAKLEPRRPFRSWLLWGGPGAVELAARFDVMRHSSDNHTARPSRSLRAVNVLQTSDRIWTFGVNWYLNHWTRVQFNAFRERVEDPVRAPIPGQTLYWSQIVRVQFVM
jgi:phosphate-selective porin